MNLGLAACVGGDNNRDPCAQDGDCPGGTCDTPQNWIDAAVNWPTNQSIRDAAHADYDSGPNRFALRSSAVNIYVLGTPGGGVCNCAYRTGPESEAIIIVGQSHHETVPAHEVGHWLGLCHTHGCGNPSDDLSGGDETPIGVYDTLPDNPCWDDAAVIALMNFGACATGADCSAPCTIETERDCADVGGCFERGQSCYPTGTVGACVTCAADIPSCTTRNLAGCTTVGGAYFGDGSSCSMYQDLLNTEQRQQVDDVFNNLMSYHWESVGHDRLTADQMDRVTNIANGVQVAITSGCTHYVDLTANPSNLIGMTACGNAGICVGGSEAGTPCVSETEPWGDCPGGICKRNLDGSSESPYLAVQEGLEAVAGVDDIVLIRGGYYREPLTIMQSVTLRGSRGGAVLGAAGP